VAKLAQEGRVSFLSAPGNEGSCPDDAKEDESPGKKQAAKAPGLLKILRKDGMPSQFSF